jgi:hypothetical protein
VQWLERIERRFERDPTLVAVTGPYRFYEGDWTDRALIRAYDHVVAPPTHVLVPRTTLRSKHNSHIVALNPREYISADQSAEDSSRGT